MSVWHPLTCVLLRIYFMQCPSANIQKRNGPQCSQCFIKCLRKENVHVGVTSLFTFCLVLFSDCQEESEILREFFLHFLVLSQLQ